MSLGLTGRLRSAFMAIIVLVAMIVGMLGGAAAIAFSDHTHPGAISDVSLTRSNNKGGPVDDNVWNIGDELRLTATWTVPDSARGGDTFGMTLPSQLRRATQRFEVPDKATGKTVAICTVEEAAAPRLACRLTDFVNDKVEKSGDLWFVAVLDEEVTATELVFETQGKTQVTAPIPGGAVHPQIKQPTNYSPPAKPEKGGWVEMDGRLGWNVVFSGDFATEDITITDALSPDGPDTQAHRNVDKRLQVQYREPGADTYWKTLDGWTGAWNETGTGYTVTIPRNILNPTYGYRTLYWTAPTEQIYIGDTFANVATINGTTLTRKVNWVAFGGGSGSAQDLGTVNLTKVGDSLPEGVSYTVEYTDGSSAEPRRLTLKKGETVYTARFKAGTVLTFKEVALPQVVGVQWGEPAFSQNPVTIKAGESIAITLTNTAEEAPRPDEPAPLVKELAKERRACESGFEVRKGTETTGHKFDAATWTWVVTDPVTKWKDWEKVRDLTPTEKVQLGCKKPDPANSKVAALPKTGASGLILPVALALMAAGTVLKSTARRCEGAS